MKRIAFTLVMMFALQAALMAQTDQEVVVFNAHLLNTFNLNVDGVDQEITFAVADDYNNGVIEQAGIMPGISLISVEATGDWDLTIWAPDFQPYAGPNGQGTGSIPIDNLGVWCVATGTHQFLTEILCDYTDQVGALGLTNDDQNPDMLIDLNPGSSNAGDISDNAFTLHWVMGTMGTNMNQESMFDQLSADVFGPGDFTTTATLTLTAKP